MAAADPRILVVRLGAMGDILHALPAVSALKRGFPTARLTWAVEPRWLPLLEENPYVDRTVEIRRDSLGTILASYRALTREHYDLAVDFQGLFKSALTAWLAAPSRIFGFAAEDAREREASVFYTNRIAATAAHVVDRNLELALAAGAAAGPIEAPLPQGVLEGELPEGPFVLASPLAGWRSKQWPLEHYAHLAGLLRARLGLPLVCNLPAGGGAVIEGALSNHTGLSGLIYATRRAAAVVGVDSGPLHLAAALERPGVALFGPTDPARNGPYGASFRVLRSPGAITTYKRGTEIDESMKQISPDIVFEALSEQLTARAAGSVVL